MNDREATVEILADQIKVSCRFTETRLRLDPDIDVRTQISAAVFAHQRECGQCDTNAAYQQGSTESLQRLMRVKAEEPPA